MKPALIGVICGGADQACLFTFETSPAINDVAADAIQNKQPKQNHGWVNIDCGYTQSDENNHRKRHTLLHADVFETVKGHIGHHGEA